MNICKNLDCRVYIFSKCGLNDIEPYSKRLSFTSNKIIIIKTPFELTFDFVYHGNMQPRSQGLRGETVTKTLVKFILSQSRSQSPRSSVGGIVGLWENAEENQPFIGCLIISLTHSLLIEICAILIIQKA